MGRLILINAQDTQIEAFHCHTDSGRAQAQQDLIYSIMERLGGDWSIGEMANYTRLDKSTVSARMFHLREKLRKISWSTKRKDKVSNVTVKPMCLPKIQRELFI